MKRFRRFRRGGKAGLERRGGLVAIAILLLLTGVWSLRGGEQRSQSAWRARSASGAAGDLIDMSVKAAVARTAYTPQGREKAVVLLTAVNYAFREYLVNFNCSLRAAGGAAYVPLVISMDADMHAYAQRTGFESLYLPMLSGGGAVASGDGEEAHLFGSKGFNLLSKQKLYAVYKVLQTGVDVLFSDADIVWCSDAVAEVAAEMYARNWSHDPITPQMPHLLMQTAWPRSLLNSGFYYARASTELLHAFEAFLAHDADSENDQVIVNRVMCRSKFRGDMIFNGTYSHPSAPARLMPAVCRWDGRVDARLLDAGRFPTGGEIIEGAKIFHHSRKFVAGLCSKKHVSVLHNNCILTSKKKARFIVKGMWHVDRDGETCMREPAPATLVARRRCGGAKCGPEGDTHRYPQLVV